MLNSKIILGSANFSNNYGILNKKLDKDKISNILKLAKKINIHGIDTSPSYGSSEKILGKINNNFLIYSKVPKFRQKLKKDQIKKKIYKIMNSSLKNLRKSCTKGVLLQDANILLSKNGDIIYKTLKEIKMNGLTKNIGISIYDFNSMKKILKKYKFDFVQVPFNLFNRDLISSKALSFLKKKNIEIHVRSIFLQGILLLNKKKLPSRLKKLNNVFIKYKNYIKRKNINSLEYNLDFILSHKIDKIVIGVSSVKDLKEIINYKFSAQKKIFPHFIIKNKKLINPTYW